MKDISRQLSFGSRALDTSGHRRAIRFIETELARTRASVSLQEWTETNGNSVHRLTNIIARFDVSNPRRIIVGTHYDSIGRAYRDIKNPNGPMPGANNSASGVALLLETARVLSQSVAPPAFGVDFIFFDGEEGQNSLGAGDPRWFALGSPYYAKHISDFYPHGPPQVSVIFDMVCYRNIKLFMEASSLVSAASQVSNFWKIGEKTAPAVFVRGSTIGQIGDDQTAFQAIGIPSFLVIGFEYDPWFNTTRDTIDKCSPRSLEAVGRTLLQYLY